MIKQRLEMLVQKYKEANAYDPRLDPAATGWYFPGQRNLTTDPLPPAEEGLYLDSEEMIRLINKGIAETEREMASVAFKATSNQPRSYDN